MGVKQTVKMNDYGKKRYVWEERDATRFNFQFNSLSWNSHTRGQ